jgi:hypothetical protein
VGGTIDTVGGGTTVSAAKNRVSAGVSSMGCAKSLSASIAASVLAASSSIAMLSVASPIGALSAMALVSSGAELVSMTGLSLTGWASNEDTGSGAGVVSLQAALIEGVSLLGVGALVVDDSLAVGVGALTDVESLEGVLPLSVDAEDVLTSGSLMVGFSL